MILTLAVSGYRSIRSLVLPLERLNVITGGNGTGKSSLYRALRLLADVAQGRAIGSLALEGGLQSTLWAGPEFVSRAVKRGHAPVQGTVRQTSWRSSCSAVTVALTVGATPVSVRCTCARSSSAVTGVRVRPKKAAGVVLTSRLEASSQVACFSGGGLVHCPKPTSLPVPLTRGSALVASLLVYDFFGSLTPTPNS